MGKFVNKTVIVTGASSGIGAATAVAFAREGANLAICGRNEERLNQTATHCENIGCKVLKMIGDVKNIEYLESVITETVKTFQTIDVLVNNAGRGQAPTTLSEIEVAGYEDMFQTNLRAPVFLSKFAYPHLKKTKGCVVNVSSIFSLAHVPLFMEYAMAKSGLDHFTRCFASEGAPFGVRVNGINPASSNTPLVNKAPKEVRDWAESLQPFGFIEPDSIAEGILFLSSSPYITGINMAMDGGYLVRVDDHNS